MLRVLKDYALVVIGAVSTIVAYKLVTKGKVTDKDLDDITHSIFGWQVRMIGKGAVWCSERIAAHKKRVSQRAQKSRENKVAAET